MIAIPLGKIAVTTPGTPVSITAAMTAAQLAQLAPNRQCNKVEIWPDPAATGKVSVKQAGVVTATFPIPGTTGFAIPWHTPEVCGNPISPDAFSLDVTVGGEGAFVTLWVA